MTAHEATEHVHLIGIGGIGVSGVARTLLARGVRVSGSDVRESSITRALRDEGAEIVIGHDAAHVAGAGRVVYSTAVPETNPELRAARDAGIPLVHRAELLGELLARHRRSVGVTGTHGKGTVAAAVAWILEHAGRRPGFVVGGLLENFDRVNARLTEAEELVAEVDESDGSLRDVHPAIAVVNNLEADHLNYYDSLGDVQDTVAEALERSPRPEHVVLSRDDPGAWALAERLTAPVTSFGRSEAAEVRGTDVEVRGMGSRFEVRTADGERASCRLALPGLYNVDNALAAIAAARALDVPLVTCCEALATFRGLENRFTVVDVGRRRIVKDYISHPTGMRRVLRAAREDPRPIVAVFKPYRFTMVHYLLDDYGEAFHDAAEAVITEMYTAGEVPIPGADTASLCERIRAVGTPVRFVRDMEDIVPYLHERVGEDMQVIFFGGDDLFELADRYASELAEAEGA